MNITNYFNISDKVNKLFQMANSTQKLMHYFDEQPSQMNPHALDVSISGDNNFTSYIISPVSRLDTDLDPSHQKVAKLYDINIFRLVRITLKKQSFTNNNSKRSSKVQPDTLSPFTPGRILGLTDLHRKSKALSPYLEKYRVEQNTRATKILKQEQPENLENIISQIDELTTSPNGRLISFAESFINGQTQLKEKKTRKSPLMVYYLIKRFMTKISIQRRQKLFFKARHFDIVNDKASENVLTLIELDQNNGKNNGMICWFGGKYIRQLFNQYIRCKNRWMTNIGKLIKHIPLIYPQAMGKIIWDIILCIVLIYFFIMIPIQICFENKVLFVEYPINALLILFLICDLFLKMNTVFYEYGKPVTDRYRIFYLNIENGFLLDGLSITVLIIATFYNFNNFQNTNILNLILLFFYSQFRHFTTIVKRAEESLNLSKVVKSGIDLIKLLSTILFVEHIFSCLWFQIAMFKQRQNQNNWLAASDLLDESWEIQYLVSFYFSTVTMLSVGYGDIVPTNSLERSVCIFFMLFACIQLSYTVSTVGQIIDSLSKSGDEGKEKMRIVNKYMNENAISFGLQYEVREYLKIYWKQQVVQESYEEAKIVLNLSEGLRNKLIFEANNSILMSCPLFQKHFSQDIKVKLLKVMKQVVISPETVITSQINSIDEPCLCFVQLGELDVCMNQQSQLDIGSYSKGMHFGLDDFITGQTPHIQLSSQAFVKLIVITRSDFLKEINERPNDYEEFCMIKDQYMFQTQVLEDKCFSCQCTGHDIFNCPLVHFVIDREKIIKSYQFYQKQISVKFRRSPKRQKNQFSACRDQWAIQEISQILQNQEEDRCYYYDKVNHLYQQTYELTESPSFVNMKPIKQLEGQKVSIKFTFDKADLFSMKQRFQRAVRKLIILLSIPGANKLAFNQSDTDKLCGEIIKFNANLHTQFIKLKNEQLDFIQHRSLKPKELEDIHFLILKMNLINVQEYTQNIIFTTKFEIQKEFSRYLPHNNLDQVIQIYDQSEPTQVIKQWLNQDPSHKNTIQRQNILRVSLTNYMMFPYDYFKKFCKPEPEEAKQTRKIQAHRGTNARLLFQKFKKKNQEQRKLRDQKGSFRLQPLNLMTQGSQ